MNLAVAFFDYRDEILAFTTDLAVDFSNYAEVRVMPKSVTAPWRGGLAAGLSSA